MFDGLTKKLAQKMGRTVQEAAQPIKKEVSKAANNKVDLWSRVLRLGVLIFLFVDGTRRVVADPEKKESSPQQIVINNYVDTRPYNRPRNQQKGYDHRKGG